MTEDKLSKWLTNKGLLGNKEQEQTPPKKAFTKKPLTKKPVPKTEKPVTETAKTQKAPVKNSIKKAPSKPAKKLSNHDPFRARPTVEKREKFHPTNFLPKLKAGEIRVVPLGGMEQVGENMMFIEWANDIIIIDTGFLFPGPEHLGIDVLIPDISYLVKNKKKIRGVIYTHGHLDHIGGAPYILPELGLPPMYATKLTKELLLAQCSEHNRLDKKLNIREVNPKSKIKLGKFEIEFFHINHSIPDGVGIVVKTPYGSIVHTSDFKFDYNPADDQPIDLSRISKIGKDGVALAMVDSTNAMKTGQTISESVIGDSLSKVIQEASGRVIVATFSSNIGRISKLIEAAEKDGRTVFLSGRSMERNVGIARKLNYLNCRDKTLQRMNNKANKMNPKKVLILSTGSQGEDLAALTRMAAGTHRDIKLSKEDTVVFSASPIPGNELAVVSVLNNLAKIGCKKIDNKDLDIHVSGHAHAEECKLMTSLLNPKYFAPIHGETFMRYAHRDMIVRDLQIKEKNTFMIENGRGILFNGKTARLMTEKESLVSTETLVQLKEKVHDTVLEDRKLLSENGILIIAICPEKGRIKHLQFRAKGFLYNDTKQEIFKTLEKIIRDLWVRNYDPSRPESVLEMPIKEKIRHFFFQKFRHEQQVEVLIK